MKRNRSFRLTDDEWELLLLLGSGNAHDGLRNAITEAMDLLGSELTSDTYLESNYPDLYKEIIID